MNSQPLSYTINGACNAIGIGRTKLYFLIGQGLIDTIRIGGRTLIPASSLRRLIGEAA